MKKINNIKNKKENKNINIRNISIKKCNSKMMIVSMKKKIC